MAKEKVAVLAHYVMITSCDDGLPQFIRCKTHEAVMRKAAAEFIDPDSGEPYDNFQFFHLRVLLSGRLETDPIDLQDVSPYLIELEEQDG